MPIERTLSARALRRRSIGVLLLFAVFFLLFHFHAVSAVPSQLNHECSCLHGTRAQIGIAAVVNQWTTPALQFFLLPFFQFHLISQVVIGFRSIRAPPLF
jgi:hypothetical protein